MRDLDVPDLQLVQQQADPVQEEHREGPGGGERVRSEGGLQGGQPAARFSSEPCAFLGRRSLSWRWLLVLLSTLILEAAEHSSHIKPSEGAF